MLGDGTWARVSWIDRLFRVGAIVWAVACLWLVLTDSVVCAQSTCLVASGPGARVFEVALVTGYGLFLWVAGVATLGLLTVALRRAGSWLTRASDL